MKILLGKLPYIYPIPIALLGANVAGKPNYATVGDFGLMGINPALVCVSLHRDHYTTQGILENETFSDASDNHYFSIGQPIEVGYKETKR